MARTTITAQNPVAAGITPTYEAANVDGHMFTNTGYEILHVKNNNAGALTVTLQTALTIDGLAVADRTVTVAAGAEKLISALSPHYYNQAAGSADANKVYVDYSLTASVTVAVLKSNGP